MAQTTAVGYIRVSTDKQAEEGCSLDAQMSKLKAYAALYDINLICVEIDDGASAKTLDRTGMQNVLSMLRDGSVNAVLVAKLDRLTRSVRDLADLIDEFFMDGKCQLLSVSDSIDTRTASGRLILNMLTSVFQWEREVISERTRDAMQFKISKGEYTGGKAPYGYTVVSGELVPNEREQSTMARARVMRALGMTYRQIGAQLAVEGMTTRNGGTFSSNAVIEMVK